MPGWRFLGYLQDHDQVGNRAQGERSSHLLSVERLKIAAALVLTSPFVPMLFMGEEWGATSPFQYFTDHQDAALGAAVSEGRRNEFASFGWAPEDVPDPQDPATFERSKLQWAEVAEAPHAELLEWHRALIALRRSTPALTDGRLGDVVVTVDEDEGHLLVRRGPVQVAVNLGTAPWSVPLAGRVALSSPADLPVEGGAVKVPPDGLVISS
jgi:maltooligosyltrehalose trehalohydrolase